MGLLFIVFLLATWAALALAMPQIEHDLTRTSQRNLLEAGLFDVEVEFHGREASLSGTVDRTRKVQLATGLVEAQYGVRRVTNHLRLRARPVVTVEPIQLVEPEFPVIDTSADAAPDAGVQAAPGLDAAEEAAVDEAAVDAPERDAPPADDAGSPGADAAQAAIDALQFKVRKRRFFRTASSKLTWHGRQHMRRIAAVLAAHPGHRVTVESHTDSWGRAKNNLKLSQRRAEAVVAFLAANGVAAERLTPVGRGEAQPIADNNRRAGRKKNRRIEFIVEGGR